MQALSGHGCFAEYLHRFKLLTSSQCWFCGSPCDDAKHTVFKCNAWQAQRDELAEQIGTITPDNLVERMTSSPRAWDDIAGFITAFIKAKEAEERRRKGADTNT